MSSHRSRNPQVDRSQPRGWTIGSKRIIGRGNTIDSSFEHLQPQHGALHARRAYRNPQLLEKILAADCFYIIEGATIHHLHQDGGGGLAYRATPARKAYVGDVFTIGADVDSDFVAAKWVDI